jgi:hypothetical protein
MLFIMRAQLNPIGKRAAGINPDAKILLNEWVEIENFGNNPIFLSKLSVTHKFLDEIRGKTPVREIYWRDPNSQEVLLYGQKIRIHTGHFNDWHLINDEQKRVLNRFANRNRFIFNNELGGAISVSWINEFEKRQSERVLYDANQLEGAVLRLKGIKLMPNTRNWLANRIPQIRQR